MSKVYFTDFRTHNRTSHLEKLSRLMDRAGIADIDFQNKYVAIKIHFGEPGNLAFLRPNFARVVAEKVKALGGKPFLTDCNTLYVGGRKNALDHLDSAYQNGFSPYATGCQLLIADGLKGTDDVAVPVDGEYVREAYIGRAIMDADIVISLNHFKGHEATGFGGAIKNLGMGSGSRAGKMHQHNAGKPEIDQDACVGCGVCAKGCAHDAIEVQKGKARIDHEICVGCGRCIGNCAFDAVHNPNDSAFADLSRKMAEYALAVVQGRPNFHINIAMDISPYCDCHAENDVAILPDVGMFASFDPVALDVACADACNAMEPNAGSLLADRISGGGDRHDHFDTVTPATDWRVCMRHSEKMGIGSMRYELITV